MSTTVSTPDQTGVEPHELDRVVVRFAGDSGDGMQLVGDRFTELSAIFGNDLATLPNYPAEIRAPAGTVAGVSSFQVHISDSDIVTPGDSPNVLVAMNPAALLQVCLDVHGTAPAAWLLAIRGECFALGEPLSCTAQASLDHAVTACEQWL